MKRSNSSPIHKLRAAAGYVPTDPKLPPIADIRDARDKWRVLTRDEKLPHGQAYVLARTVDRITPDGITVPEVWISPICLAFLKQID